LRRGELQTRFTALFSTAREGEFGISRNGRELFYALGAERSQMVVIDSLFAGAD
jgi:hypothetical protein